MIEFRKLCFLLPAVGSVALSGCGAPEYEFDSDFHITKERVSEETPSSAESIPDLIGSTAELPELSYQGSGETYTVIVDEVSVRQVLRSLADSAQLNLDIDPTIDGLLTINAYEQTIPQLLARIQKQVAIRYEQIGNTIIVLPDDYYIKQYLMNYPGLSRTYTATAEGSVPTTGEGSLGESTIETTKDATGSVWLDLEEALQAIFEGLVPELEEVNVGPTDIDRSEEALALNQIQARQPDVSDFQPFVHILPDASLIIVHGNAQHHVIAESVIRKVASSAIKQVLLQATVVEIALNNQYQQGIDWSLFNGSSNNSPKIVQSAGVKSGPVLGGLETAELEEFRLLLEALYPAAADGTPNSRVAELLLAESQRTFFPQSSSATGGFLNATFQVNDLAAAVTLLDTFGDTRVVSSPRISTLNGQPAILKVVTDLVYFTIERERETEDGVVTETITTEEETIPVGFVVNVYPQIGDDGTIILSMRPSISRVTGYAIPPTVGAGDVSASSGVPIVSVKEIETLMLLQDGQTAVMGGLIEDQLQDRNTAVPGAKDLPGFGDLFQNKDESTRRVEYVIFVSAKIIANPSIYGDYSDYQDLLPSDETFRRDRTGSILSPGVSAVPRTVN